MEMSFFERKPNNIFGVDDAVIGSAVAFSQTPAGREITDSIGDFLHGKPEDKSNAAFQAFLPQIKQLPYLPTKQDMINASQSWEPHIRQAIADGYDPNVGAWDSPKDDWKGAVVSLNPIQAIMFKGHNEHHTLSSNVNATPPAPVQKKLLNSLSGAADISALGLSENTIAYLALAALFVTALVIFLTRNNS